MSAGECGEADVCSRLAADVGFGVKNRIVALERTLVVM
jgi:hypothetical protein